MSTEAIKVGGEPISNNEYVPSADIRAGEVIVINGACRVAVERSSLASDTVYKNLAMEESGGLYELIKDGTASVSFADGDPVFWSAGTNLATATNTDTYFGVAIKISSATDTRVRVRHQMPGTLYSGNLVASGTLAVGGNATLSGTLAVGATTITGAASASTTVTVGTRLLTSATNTGVTATASTYTALTTDKDTVPLIGVTGQTGYGWKLPTGVAGMTITLINTTAYAGVLVPATGGTINGLSANAAVVIAASKCYIAKCTAADTWHVFEAAKATAV